MLFCAILIFTMALPVAAYADTAVVTSGTMYSYFQTYGSNGVWKDIQTPSHWITSTGEVAYCLQTSMDQPYNSSYSTVDGSYYYSDYVLTGLMAILQNGYPSTNAGFTDEQARYATANAIRFFLAENYADGVPQYLNLNVNGDWIRGKSGYEELYEWALYLVDLARWGAANPGSSGSLSFSPSSLALTEDSSGQYFTGSITVNKNISGPYGIAHSLPSGTLITGYTGDRSETLTIKVPTSNENGSYTLCAYGTHSGAEAKLFFWAPSQTNQQRVVTYVLENTDDYLEAYATITTPTASPKSGSIEITKTDDAGNPLSGVRFELYDGYTVLQGSGQTDSRGVITFSNLPLGTYYCKETATLPGFILDSSYHTASITENGQVARVTVRNSRGRGSIIVTKIDSETDEPLAGVHFVLKDSGGSVVAQGDTESDGRLYFEDMPVGTYTLIETSTLSGYVLDDTPREVTIPANGRMVFLSVENDPAVAGLVVYKSGPDGETLSGVHFKLTNSAGQLAAEGDTNSYGWVSFSNLPLGSYTLTETATVTGYVLDTTPIPVTLSTAGQLVTKSITNSKALGSIVVVKTDADTGAPLSGVQFRLATSSGTLLKQGSTGSDGKLTFSGLPLGTYNLYETATQTGYVLDSNPVSVTILANGQTVTKNITNSKALGSIVVVKTDADTGAALSGVHFVLTDSSGTSVGGGGTDENGRLTFGNLPLGTYTLTETETRNGYVLDETPISVTLSSAGQVVTKSIINSRAVGSVAISKTDSETGQALAGVHFVLRDEAGALCAEGDTAADGTLTLSNIPVGRYTLRETETLTGYVLDETPREVNISENGQTVEIEVENDPIHGSLEIVKTDAHDNIPLMGAGFRLYDGTGAQIAEGYTDAQGRLSFTDLPLGEYSFREFKAPKGYVLDETAHTVTISASVSAVTETVTDERRPGTLVVKKESSDGSPLEGAAFLLEYSGDDGSTWAPVFSRTGNEITRGGCTAAGLSDGQLTTGADGTAAFTGLRADGIILYRLTETKAPPGMSLLGSSVLIGTLPVESGNIHAEDTEVFDAKAFHYTLTVTATDDSQYRLPEAGGAGFALLSLSMIAAAAPVIIIKSKRRTTE